MWQLPHPFPKTSKPPSLQPSFQLAGSILVTLHSQNPRNRAPRLLQVRPSLFLSRKTLNFGIHKFPSSFTSLTLRFLNRSRSSLHFLFAGMGRTLHFLVLISFITACTASIFHPISDSHRSAALELFAPAEDGSYGSLEETYEALRTLQILGIDKNVDISLVACPRVMAILDSPSFETKELFYALKINDFLRCQIGGGLFEDIALNLQPVIKGASSLLDFYHSIGSLVLLRDQGSESSGFLEDADGIFHSIKALSQSDGRWRYSSNGAESSTFAAGLAFEALAGVISLAGSEIDQSMVGIVKNDIVKLFDSLESYDDGAFYFDEKLVDASELHGPLSTTSSVVRGVFEFAEVTSGKFNIPGDKILGLANFFLGIGIPGSTKDLFNQMDSLAYLENNRVSIPLILSLPATVLSLTSMDQLKVKVNTVLGSNGPPLTVNLVQAFSGSKNAPVVENQKLEFDNESSVHFLDFISKGLDVGRYTLVFEILVHDIEGGKVYATGDHTQVSVFVTSFIKLDSAEMAVLDSDAGGIETAQKFDLSSRNALSLSANHLQKLRLSFELTTPLGNVFKPHQVFLKLRHETKVEHIFVLANSGKQFQIILDFLGLVEKLYYLSGKYSIELTVGDSMMENSFLLELGHVELDLPEPPEKAARPPPPPIDAYSRFGPKSEIAHIFRAPEKLPPQKLSLVFLVITLLPFVGFLAGLLRLGVNIKNFPSSALPAAYAFLFHSGIAGILLLYLLFWIKLDLFTTLKAVGFIGVFLVFVGHRALSHLASTSAKLKAA